MATPKGRAGVRLPRQNRRRRILGECGFENGNSGLRALAHAKGCAELGSLDRGRSVTASGATAPEQSKESGRNSRNRRSGDVPWSASGFAANPGGCGYSLPAQHRSGLIRHHLCRGALEMIDESCGILMPPDDAQALAATLRHLLQDGALFSRLGAEGPTRARYLLCPSRTPRPAPSFGKPVW